MKLRGRRIYKGIVEGEPIDRAKENELQVKVVRNIEKKDLQTDAYELSWTIVNRVMKVIEGEKGIVITDALSDVEFKDESSVVKHNIRSVLCFPIRIRGEVVGLIYLDT